jgi:hypothetical protein
VFTFALHTMARTSRASFSLSAAIKLYEGLTDTHMSIKVENGIPILPQVAAVEANGFLFNAISEMATALASVSGSDELDIPWMEQQRELWCWAACAKMVLHKLGQPSVRQCRIVGAFLGEHCCAASCGDDCCNEDCDATDVQPIFANFGVDADFHDDTISFSKVRAEISEGDAPVEVAIQWPGGNGGHLLIVYGWSAHSNVRRVKLNDPLYGQGEIRFSDLKEYKGGHWFATWTGFRS